MRGSEIVSAWALWIVALGAAWPASAGAAERARVKLAYERAPEASACPDRRALEDAIAARLGYDPFASDPRSEIAVSVARKREGLEASITLRDPAGAVIGSRSLSSPSRACVELSDALVLAIAVAIDPLAAMPRPPPPPPDGETGEGSAARSRAAPRATQPGAASGPRPDAAATSDRDAASPGASGAAAGMAPGASPAASGAALGTEPRSASGASEPRVEGSAGSAGATPVRSPQRITPVDERPAEPPVPVSLRAALGVLGSAGVSPKPTLGLRVEGRARWPSVSLGVEGRFDLPRATDIEQSAVSASVLAATLSPCLHHAAFLACALITAGALRGEGQRLDGARSVTTPFAAGGGRLGAEIAIGEPFALVLHADVLAAFTRTSLLVGGAEAWRSAPVSVALGGALVLEIP